MYRKIAALLLLIVLTLSQGASCRAYQPVPASRQAHFATGHVDYLQPQITISDPATASGPAKLPGSKYHSFQQLAAGGEAAGARAWSISLLETSDHDRSWITETTTLLYPAHEFS